MNSEKPISRQAQKLVRELQKGYPILTVVGPRQSGKTTLARQCFPHKRYVSLESPDEREFARTDGRGFLARFPKGAIIDEAQHVPELFSWLQTEVDLNPQMGKFILTGSQQFLHMAGISQSLAGRSGYVRLLPLSIAELRRAKKLPTTIEQMILWGGYPALYSRRITASRWHADYVQTYLERDVRALTQVHDLALFQKFLRLCAGRSGQLLNMANLANEAGIAQSTVKAWLSVLQASFILYLLPPYFQNMGKRLVKMPKLYFYDSGLAAYLLGIHREEHLLAHPLKGALFETLIMSEMMKARLNAGLAENLYFWRDNIGNEIDAVLDDEGVLRAYEIKAASTLHADMLKGLIKWRTLISERSTLVIESAQLISTTPGSYTREGVLCRPWHQFT